MHQITRILSRLHVSICHAEGILNSFEFLFILVLITVQAVQAVLDSTAARICVNVSARISPPILRSVWPLTEQNIFMCISLYSYMIYVLNESLSCAVTDILTVSRTKADSNSVFIDEGDYYEAPPPLQLYFKHILLQFVARMAVYIKFYCCYYYILV